MICKVVIYNGWSKSVFYYCDESAARSVFEYARQDKKEAHIFRKIDNEWVVFD